MATRDAATKDKDAKAAEEKGNGADAQAEVPGAEEIGFGEIKHDLPDEETCRTVLSKMMLIRRFEERAGEMYAKAKIGGFLHLCIGEEATVVGATQALNETDYLMSTYREHGQALARGTDPNAVMAELFGRQDGCSKGRGGSMHLFDWERRFLGGYGIVGGSLPLSAGVALACDYLESDDAILSMMGDGATNQGTFGETMNLAALWKLPVVFLIINNQFGMGTALHRHSAVTDLSLKSEGFGVPGTRCDGMDVLDVHAVVTEALKSARDEREPQLVEAVTYRYRGHSMADPEEYRSKEEVEEWRQRDPIRAFAERLVDEDVLSQDEVEKLDQEAIERVDEAQRFADESPFPDLDSLYDDVYVFSDEVPAWWTVDERSPEVHRGEREREAGELPHELAEKGAAYAGVGDQEARKRRAPRDQDEEGDQQGPGEDDGRRKRARRRGPRRARGRRLMAVMRYREALNQALREEMEADEKVFLMGEDIGVFQGAFKVTAGLLEEFGEKRVRDTPISENTIVGMGVGSAMLGLRPVVELMTINFSLLAMDQIVNHAAAIRYMFGGQVKVPLVVRMPQGAGHQLGPTHSHCFEAFYLHVPGLLVAVPSTPADAKGLLKAAIKDDNPVVFIEHETLYGQRGEVPENGGPMRFGEAAVRREGDDVTLIGISRMAITAQKAADVLAEEHEIEAEVIDPRTLRPLDLDTIVGSVKKTNRAVIVEEGWPHGGVGANIAALVQEQAFDWLDAPVQRVTGADVPMPYSKPLEQAAFPHEEHVVHAALASFRDL